MKLPRSISKLLQNKIVLYIVFFLALMMIFNYMMLGNNTAIAMFILIGFLASRFSKNMIVILVIPLILTFLFMMGNRMREGMTTSDPTSTIAPSTMPIAPSTTPSTGTTATAPSTTTSSSDFSQTFPATNTTPSTSTTPSMSTTPSSTCVNGKDSITGAACAESMTTMYKKDNRLDYAATVEDAYADLDKILGGDGIKNLTSDTQKLMEQQTQLATAMKGMAPLLEQAKGMLQGFDLKNLDGLASMAKNFGSAAAPAPAN